MFSSNLPRLLWEGLAFILVAMVLLDPIMLYVATVYIIFLIFAIAIGQPRGIHVKRERTEFKATVGDVADVSTHLSVEKGVGIVTIADRLPPFFKLDGEDSDLDINSFGNFRVLWKGTGRLSEDIHYRVELTKRGLYEIGAPVYETIDVAAMKQASIGSDGQTMKITVSSKPVNVKSMRSAYLRSSVPMPLNTLTSIGPRTNDFLEIREYKKGDPYNRINWKATARLSSCRPNASPLLNEYEREGKKTVWIFLDNSAGMRLGTDLDNVFECGVRATSALSRFYLSRGCRVGLSFYRGGTLLPDTGRRQEYRIASALLNADAASQEKAAEKGEPSLSYTTAPGGDPGLARWHYPAETVKGTLRYTVDSNRWHLVGQNPLFMVITMVSMDNIKELLEGIKRLRIYSVANRSQVIVINILGYDLVARGAIEEASAKLINYSAMPAIKALRSTGAYIVPWDARRESNILKKITIAGVTQK